MFVYLHLGPGGVMYSIRCKARPPTEPCALSHLVFFKEIARYFLNFSD